MSGRNKLFPIMKRGGSIREGLTSDFINSITAELQRLSAGVGGDALINGAGVFPRKKSKTRLRGKTTVFHAQGKYAKSVQAHNRFADMEKGNWVLLEKVNNGFEIWVGDPCASASGT